MSPELSVIIPVRNAARTLDEALESCRKQSLCQLEILVVLNGCEDDSETIANRHADEDERVRIMKSSRAGGVIEAQRTGVAAARSSFIARMDADDRSHPDRLAKQKRMIEEDRSLGVVGCRVCLIGAQGEGMERYVAWVNSLADPGAVARQRFVECPVIQPSLLFRREVLEQVGGYRDTSWAEDHDLVLRLLADGVRIGTVGETLLEWRDSPGRLTRSHARYAEGEVWKLKAHHLARLPQVRSQGVVVAGAGPIGKRLARLLRAEGATVQAFLEVNVRRIGQRIGGVPVLSSDELPRFRGSAVLLSAVGVPGGRDRVRGIATPAGFVEGDDFWCCC